MNMKFIPTLRYLLIAIIFLTLVALGSWYLFLRTKQGEITDVDARRGTDLPARSFGSPVGSTYENIVSNLPASAGSDGGEEAGKLPRLAHINKTPVAGAGFVGSGTSTRVRFVERGTGFVFDVSPETGTLERLTNTLVPHIYRALITKTGAVIAQSESETGAATTFVGTVSATSSSETTRVLSQKPLAEGIRSFAVSPDGKEIFYIVEEPGGAVGIRAASDGTPAKGESASGGKQIFSSAISGWQVRWSSNDRIILIQNASDNVAGYAGEIGKDGAFAPLIRNVPGLTLLPRPSSQSNSPALLYGASSGGLSLFMRVNETSTAALLPIRTIADKCVWAPAPPKTTQDKPPLVAYCAVPQGSPPSDFLNRWYRGEVHTTDAWWRVDASAVSAEILYSPGSIELDVENPVIDDSGTYIAFMNAADKSLWLLRIAE